MVERSLSMREVPGSIPGASTIFFMKVHQNSALPSKTDVHRPGIEPGPPAWQASILPLNQRCFLLGVMKKLGPTAMLNVGRVAWDVCHKIVPQSVGFEPTLPEGN